MINIKVAKNFQKQFKKIAATDHQYILERVEAFASESKNIDVKKMQPKKLNYYRLRAGKYRIVFYYSGSDEATLLKIDKRDSIYFGI